MKSKTSLFNKGIFLNSIKRFGWISVIYFIIMFFTIPIGIINTCGKYNFDLFKESLYYIHNIFDNQSLLVFTIPVFMGIMLFRYNQTKNTSDLIHSLPIRRESLFISNIIVGLILIILPVILIALISIILLSSYGLSSLLNIILYWMIGTILFNIMFFSVSVFSGMITGISTLQGVFTYMLLLLPYGLSTLIRMNIKNLFYGFLYSYTLEQKIIKLSPIMRIYTYNSDFTYKLATQEITIYLIVSIIIIITSYYLYKLRKIESATNSITFNVLKPIFKYGVTFSSMLLAGLIYSETTNSFSWMVFGYIVGSLIGYFIAEMIIKKSFYVFKNIKGYLIYAIVMVIIFTGIHFDITGFGKYIPDEEDIIAVSFYKPPTFPEHVRLYDNMGLKSEESIKNMINTHKEVIKNKKVYRNYDGITYYLYVSYKLKNGKHIYREYKIPLKLFNKYKSSIKNSKEYKESFYKIFKYKASEITGMILNINESAYKGYKKQSDNTLVITNKNDLAELKVIIENEIINMKLEDSYVAKKSVYIDYGNGIRENIYIVSDVSIRKWLDEKGYLK